MRINKSSKYICNIWLNRNRC